MDGRNNWSNITYQPQSGCPSCHPTNSIKALKWTWSINHSHGIHELSSFRDGRPFGHNRHGPKSGGASVPLSVGVAGSHLTQCGMGQGLPPYQVASWSIQPFGHNKHEPKIGGRARFGGAGSPSNTMWPGPTSTPISRWSIQPFGDNTPTLQTDRQDRTYNGQIAYGELFYKRQANHLLARPSLIHQLTPGMSHTLHQLSDSHTWRQLNVRSVVFHCIKRGSTAAG